MERHIQKTFKKYEDDLKDLKKELGLDPSIIRRIRKMIEVDENGADGEGHVDVCVPDIAISTLQTLADEGYDMRPGGGRLLDRATEMISTMAGELEDNPEEPDRQVTLRRAANYLVALAAWAVDRAELLIAMERSPYETAQADWVAISAG